MCDSFKCNSMKHGFPKALGYCPKPFLSFSLTQDTEFCQQQMKLLTREGQREWSFFLVLDKALKWTPDARGSWEGGGGGSSRPGRYAGFCSGWASYFRQAYLEVKCNRRGES